MIFYGRGGNFFVPGYSLWQKSLIYEFSFTGSQDISLLLFAVHNLFFFCKRLSGRFFLAFAPPTPTHTPSIQLRCIWMINIPNQWMAFFTCSDWLLKLRIQYLPFTSQHCKFWILHGSLSSFLRKNDYLVLASHWFGI